MDDIRWEETALYFESNYNSYVNWEERFFICPKCGELVYEKEDWGWINPEELCPICGFSLEDEEDYEEDYEDEEDDEEEE